MSEFDTVLGSFGTVVDVFNILSSVATLVLGFMGFVVSKIMQDRTLYDIAYDDGDAEQGVELSDLRQVGGGGESQSQKLLASQDV